MNLIFTNYKGFLMTAEIVNPDRSKMSLWLQASRFFVVSGSMIPVILAAMTAVLYKETINWYLFPVALFAAVLFHIGANMISEYHDYRSAVDRKETFGSSRILVDELLPPKQVLIGGFIVLGVGFLLGLILVYFRGLNIFLLGMCGVIGAIFYGAKPFELKYHALGDLVIFLLFGPLLSIGSYLGMTGQFNWDLVWITMPIAFLIVGVLHANNTRDIKFDTIAGIKTQASVLGLKGAQFEYYFLIAGAFVVIPILIFSDLIGYWGFLVFASLPPAIKNIRAMSKATVETPETIALLDVATAQHHMMFGLLYSIAILLSALI